MGERGWVHHPRASAPLPRHPDPCEEATLDFRERAGCRRFGCENFGKKLGLASRWGHGLLPSLFPFCLSPLSPAGEGSPFRLACDLTRPRWSGLCRTRVTERTLGLCDRFVVRSLAGRVRQHQTSTHIIPAFWKATRYEASVLVVLDLSTSTQARHRVYLCSAARELEKGRAGGEEPKQPTSVSTGCER